MNYDSMVRLVRRVRKADEINRIEAIKMVRTAFPEVGLKGAKDFVLWMPGSVPATTVAGQWCRECWNDRIHCDHDPVMQDMPEEDVQIVNAMATAMTKGAGEVAAPRIDIVELPKAACRCGDAKCADPWHAAGVWVGQPGNYAKLQAWLNGEEVEGLPFERHGVKVLPKGVE